MAIPKLILNPSMKKLYVLGLIVALSTVLVVPRVHAAGSSAVVFSEIAWGGSQKSTADEWIEITNLGSGAVDVSGWTMTGLATSGGVLTIPANTSLVPGGTYVIANYQMGSSSTLLTTPDLVTTAVSIPNTALNFALLDANGNVIDSLVDPGTPDAGSNSTFATMERDSGDLSWVTAEVSTNLDGGQFGSPGVSGHLVAPAVGAIPTATVEPVVADSPAEPVTSAPEVSPAPSVVIADSIVAATPVEAEAATPAVADPAVTTPIVTNDPIVTSDPTTSAASTTAVEPASAAPIETVADPAPVTADYVAAAPAESDIDYAEITPIVPEATIEPPVIESVVIQGSSIIITSLLPSPNTGEDETLTLTNTGDAAVVIDGYTLVDASGKITTLTGSIEPNANFVVTNPAGNLNNDGDSISLFDAAGTRIDVVTYGTDEVPAPKKNVELQLVDGVWSSASDAAVIEPIEATDSQSVEVQTDEIESSVTSSTSDEAITPVASDVIPEVPAQSEQVIVASIVTEPVVADSMETPVVVTIIDPGVVALEAASTTSDIPSDASIDLIITSLLPAPSAGDDEWVELANRSEMSVDLSAYSLVDASGAITSLSGTLDAGATTMILNPKGKLNNDSDTVTLLDSAGNAIDSVTYGGDASATPKKDEVVTFASISPTIYANQTVPESTDTHVATSSSHSGQAATSAMAAPTFSAAATHSILIADSTVKTPTSKTLTVKTATKVSSSSAKKSSVAARNVSISDIASLADETLVTLEGTVVAVPGMIGKRSFFVDGLEVYQSQDDLAAVSIGDHVRITGTVSVLSDHRRVNIKAGGVTILGSSTPVVHDYAVGLLYGSLVRITGTVSARDGNAVVLATDVGNVTVTLGNGVTMKWSDVASKKVTVTGVLKSTDGAATIVLRNAEDVVIMADAIDQTAAAAGTSATENFPWSVAGLAAVAFVGLGAWFWRMKPRSSLTGLTLKPSNV